MKKLFFLQIKYSFFLTLSAKTTFAMKKTKILKKLQISGIFAGFVNGFLGSGGGIIMLNSLLKSGIDKRKAHASCVLAILPLSLVSAFFYKDAASIDFLETSPLFIGCCIGGVVGALFLSRINKTVLEIVFDGIIVFSGIRMLF